MPDKRNSYSALADLLTRAASSAPRRAATFRSRLGYPEMLRFVGIRCGESGSLRWKDVDQETTTPSMLDSRQPLMRIEEFDVPGPGETKR